MLLLVLPLLLECVTASFHRPYAFRLSNSPLDWHKVPDPSYEVRENSPSYLCPERCHCDFPTSTMTASTDRPQTLQAQSKIVHGTASGPVTASRCLLLQIVHNHEVLYTIPKSPLKGVLVVLPA